MIFKNQSLPISCTHIMLIRVHFLFKYLSHTDISSTCTYRWPCPILWKHSVKSLVTLYDYSSTTQVVSEAQLIREDNNVNFARNFQSINFPQPWAANKYLKFCKILLHINDRCSKKWETSFHIPYCSIFLVIFYTWIFLFFLNH